MKHANIAVFVPHNGCPNQCSFCDQREITGTCSQPNTEDVQNAIDTARKSLGDKCKDAEIAFFGGSFTAIDRGYMKKLLDAAYPAVESGEFKGIRISTRPDAIDDAVLDTLKSRGVTAVELGAQSMNDDVLLANHRGHTRKDITAASEKIKKKGFSLGLQMMTGLYMSNSRLDIQSAEDIASLLPDTVRIYPTVVLKNTELCRLYETGEYRPQQLGEAVELCAKLLLMFESRNIAVIRLGLHDSDSLRDNMVAGAFHPAFRELCESEIMFEAVLAQLEKYPLLSGGVEIYVNPSSVSKLVGQKRRNIERLGSMGIRAVVRQDSRLGKYDVRVSACPK